MPTLLIPYITIGNKQCTPTLLHSYSIGESVRKQCNFVRNPVGFEHQFQVNCSRHCATRAHRQRAENIATLYPQLRYAACTCQYVKRCIDIV